ncbi:MAG: Swt1 family HEPN domain-containing protein [candidate division WOR-3 bacterium]|nr:Swt1 family HEPN domain-containing protein [candidate division WOR-3 bacterium]
MALSNHQRVGAALDLLNAGLVSFVERELKTALGEAWIEAVKDSLHQDQFPKKGKGVKWDTQALLMVMWDQWNSVFRRVLGQSERTLLSELRDVRNKWAHQDAFTYDDAYRALDSIARLLQAVSAEQATEVERQRDEVLRVKFDEQRRSATRRQTVIGLEGTPIASLKPWREVVTPHPDVASGNYQQAEFAADLWRVHNKEGSDEYKNPAEFFRRTFLTQGLSDLLLGALKRVNNRSANPVIDLQTNFGGGKTHALLALYHLFSGTPPAQLTGTEDLLERNGLNIPKIVNRAVIVGTRLAPGSAHKKSDGAEVRTLWGEIAWQLGGKEGYGYVADADQTATNPGDALHKLLAKYAPCVILIDEWVAYARQLHGGADLPGGTFDTQVTFAQALCDAVKDVSTAFLVVTLPESKNEIGGEWGQLALERLRNVIHRDESPWRPASSEEGFEIVRRRLFQPITTREHNVQRDAVARAFSEMYQAQHQEFPSECREADYERRILAAYPIHPELFDRLYNDWSTLDRFQRTRGVLRLMAAVIHSLWERHDSNLLIMPASVPIDDPAVKSELTSYLEEQWDPVIEKDVDGPHSQPLALDRENIPNFGRYSACRRVARTVFVGSAPLQRASGKGVDDRRVKLGCVQPGESAATFGDALRRLTDRSTFLYVDGSRYWYSVQATVARLAEDRAKQYEGKPAEVHAEIERLLKDDARRRGDFTRVHVCAPSGDIPDEEGARLVILAPGHHHTAKTADSPARIEAAAVIELRGNGRRDCPNTLVFLAPDANKLKDLETAVRQVLAWESITHDREELNLDQFQFRQAETKLRRAEETVRVRLPETYQWLLVPSQPDPKGAVEWTEARLQGQDALAARASKRLIKEESLFTEMGGTRLRIELDRVLWRGDHVGVRQLADDFAKYLYLPRLKDTDVLLAAIEDGVRQLTDDTFAYAEGWDEKTKRYVGLKAGVAARVILDARSVVVKPEVARRQLDEDAKKTTTTTTTTTGGKEQRDDKDDKKQPTAAAKPKRFHATVKLVLLCYV